MAPALVSASPAISPLHLGQCPMRCQKGLIRLKDTFAWAALGPAPAQPRSLDRRMHPGRSPMKSRRRKNPPPRLEVSEARRRKSGRFVGEAKRSHQPSPTESSRLLRPDRLLSRREGEERRWRKPRRRSVRSSPVRFSPRRPDSGPGRRRQDSAAAMAGALSWPRRSDGLTFCGWLRLSWAGGGGVLLRGRRAKYPSVG